MVKIPYAGCRPSAKGVSITARIAGRSAPSRLSLLLARDQLAVW